MEGTFFHVVGTGKWRLLKEEDESERKREETEAVAAESAADQQAEERIPIIRNPDDIQIRVYTRRWLVLFSFVMMALANNLTTYTFSSIAKVASEYYNITYTQVNLLLVVFMVSGFTFRFLAMWIIDTIGLGVGVIAAAWLTMFGNWIRRTSNTSLRSVLMNSSVFPGINPKSGYPWVLFGQCLAALGQAFVDIAAPKIAANWFPPEQRTTATSVGYMPLFLALFLSYMIGPRIVTKDSEEQLAWFLFGEAIFATCAAISVLTFFRGRPSLPPSLSQRVNKMGFREGIINLLANTNFICLFVVFCLAGGGAISFAALLTEIVVGDGYSEAQAGVFGSVWIGSAMLSSVVCGPLIDRSRKYKAIMMLAFTPASVTAVLFALDMGRVLPHSVWLMIMITFVMGLSGGGIPAVLEASVEATYPVPEATTMGLLFLGLNIFSIVLTLLLGVLKAPDGNMALSMWVLVIISVAAIIGLLFFREEYRRLEFEKLARTRRNSLENDSPPNLTPVKADS